MGEIVRIEVIPDSKKAEICAGKPLIVKVKEPAQRNRANRAVIALLSKYFSNQVRIISGTRKRRKIIEIVDIGKKKGEGRR